jgi:hypothetical protein
MSGLYFRGKLAYARAFAMAPPDLAAGAFVITASGGLVPPDTVLTLQRLREISTANVHPADPRFGCRSTVMPKLFRKRPVSNEVVLLGSIASSKYVDPLLQIFGARLVFPAEFVGRGDMSRGGLMLRCVRSGEQLTYVPVLNATRNGRKPPKLAPLARKI